MNSDAIRQNVTGRRRTWRPTWQRTWRLDIVGLCLLILLGILVRSALIQSVKGAVVVTLLIEPVTLLIVLGLRPVLVRRRSAPALDARAVLINTLLCIGAALLVTCWANVVTSLSGWSVATWGAFQRWVVPWTYYSIVFAGWGLAHFWSAAEIAARHEYQRAAAAESEALRAELHHLRHQLDPHFLFNALNGIAAEIPENPATAGEMVRELAAYLRYSLDHRDLAVSPFIAEVNAVRSYLEVQKARFGPELRFRLDADEAAGARMTPGFLLQPLVENAVKHGLKAGCVPLDIAVEAKSDGASLRISVSGGGTLRQDWKTAGDPGVGLSVLRRRLDLHYPGRYVFDMEQAGDRVTATLWLRGEPCFA